MQNNPTSPRLRGTRVLVFGTFDGLHEGHKSFLKQARAEGGYLVVVIGRDATVMKTKGRLPKFNEEERKDAVIASGLADEVRLGTKAPVGEKLNPYKVIEDIKPDVICLGYDQTHFTALLPEKLKEMGMGHVAVKKMEAFEPEKYRSSLLNK